MVALEAMMVVFGETLNSAFCMPSQRAVAAPVRSRMTCFSSPSEPATVSSMKAHSPA